MPVRVLPGERIPRRDRRLVGGDRDLAEASEDVARLGARLIIQTEVQAEVERVPRPRLLSAPDRGLGGGGGQP